MDARRLTTAALFLTLVNSQNGHRDNDHKGEKGLLALYIFLGIIAGGLSLTAAYLLWDWWREGRNQIERVVMQLTNEQSATELLAEETEEKAADTPTQLGSHVTIDVYAPPPITGAVAITSSELIETTSSIPVGQHEEEATQSSTNPLTLSLSSRK